jgi:hypothetical protein
MSRARVARAICIPGESRETAARLAFFDTIRNRRPTYFREVTKKLRSVSHLIEATPEDTHTDVHDMKIETK